MIRHGTRATDAADSNKSASDPYDSVEKEDYIPHGHYVVPDKQTLQVWHVALLVFFSVSGGPMGSEDAVRLKPSLMMAYILFRTYAF